MAAEPKTATSMSSARHMEMEETWCWASRAKAEQVSSWVSVWQAPASKAQILKASLPPGPAPWLLST